LEVGGCSAHQISSPMTNPSPICARFAGYLTVVAYTRHPWLPESSKTLTSCDIQVTVGEDSE
jgi:hypothetical protein